MQTETRSSKDKQADSVPAPPIGSPCWIEIPSVDPPKLKEFYSALFPSWTFKSPDENKFIMYEFSEPKGLTGGIIKLPPNCPRNLEQPMGMGSTVYYYVDSLHSTTQKIHSLGGTTVLSKTAEGTNGWFMNFKDPEGNRFGAYQFNWVPCKDE